MEGNGEILFKNGDKYIGNWKNNKKGGKGKIIYRKGGEYEGTVCNGFVPHFHLN